MTPDFDGLPSFDALRPAHCDTYSEIGERLPPLVLLIDALNQLVDEAYTEQYDLPSDLAWLPERFPLQMRVVLSCLDRCDAYHGGMLEVLLSRGGKEKWVCCPWKCTGKSLSDGIPAAPFFSPLLCEGM